MVNASIVPAIRRPSARRGLTLMWGVCSLTVMMGFASLAVDFGRVQVAKAELRRAADAAARAGAGSLETNVTQANYDARSWAKKNAVDGRLLKDESIAVTVGHWDTNSRSFRTTLISGESFNAVRVVLTRPAVGPESVPLMWGKAIGLNGVNVSAESIAMYFPGVNVNHQVDGVANPFLAGMPSGTVASLYNPHNSPDYAGDATSPNLAARRQSPPVVPMAVTAGDVIEFDNIAGTVRHDPALDFYSPDGQLDDVGHNTRGNENGISDTNAPIDALVGVFLGNEAPTTSSAPESDVSGSTASGRDFSQLQPKKQQIFFIGDGANSAGMRQRFVVPQGATRLYLATWDYYEWNNNAGFRIVKVQRPGRIVTVK